MDFPVLFDRAGQVPSRTNELLVRALERLDLADSAGCRALILAAAASNTQCGLRIQDVADAWAKSVTPSPSPSVGDVGTEARGTGPVPLSSMTVRNWAYYQQHNLEPKWAKIFAGVTINDVHSAIGSLPGNLATAEPSSVVDNYDLSVYL